MGAQTNSLINVTASLPLLSAGQRKILAAIVTQLADPAPLVGKKSTAARHTGRLEAAQPSIAVGFPPQI
jgi:hypothetical protein